MQRILATFVFVALISVSFFSFSTQSYAATKPTIDAGLVFVFTNVERYKRGLPFLSTNNKLSEVAAYKMKDMFTRQYFEHDAPTGESVSDLARAFDYEFIVVGENLALGDFSSSRDVVNAWMDSEGHRENILAQKYTEIGIAAGRSMFNGSKAWIIVQSFGTPKSSCPIVDSALGKKLETMQTKLDIYYRIAEVRKEQADSSDGTMSERKARIESYNLIARFYNNMVEDYRDLVVEYNETVGEYNDCLEDIIKSV